MRRNKNVSKTSATANKVNHSNPENAAILDFCEFVKISGVTERHQNNNMKAVVFHSGLSVGKS